MIRDTNIRYSGITSKEVYDIISKAASDNCISISKYISKLMENEACRISGKDISCSTRSYTFSNDIKK